MEKLKGETLNRAIALIEKYQNDELITPGLAPHAPHTVTKEVIRNKKSFWKI